MRKNLLILIINTGNGRELSNLLLENTLLKENAHGVKPKVLANLG